MAVTDLAGEVEDTLLSVVVTAAGEEVGAEGAQLAVEAVGVLVELAEWQAADGRPAGAGPPRLEEGFAVGEAADRGSRRERVAAAREGLFRTRMLAQLREDCTAATQASSGATFHRAETRSPRIARNIGTNGAKIIMGGSLTSGLTGARIGITSTIFGIIGTHLTLLTNRNGTTIKTT